MTGAGNVRVDGVSYQYLISTPASNSNTSGGSSSQAPAGGGTLSPQQAGALMQQEVKKFVDDYVVPVASLNCAPGKDAANGSPCDLSPIVATLDEGASAYAQSAYSNGTQGDPYGNWRAQCLVLPVNGAVLNPFGPAAPVLPTAVPLPSDGLCPAGTEIE